MDYFLKTARLGFRCWTADDFELARGLWGDPEVTRLIGGPWSADQVRERLEKEIAGQAGYGVQYWPIFHLENEAHVGCCGLRPYNLEQGVYELGFHIRSSCWRRGYAREAAQAVIAYAFGPLEAQALFAGHNPNNTGSRQLLLKLGFCYSHDEFYAPTGLNHPSYLLRKEKQPDVSEG